MRLVSRHRAGATVTPGEAITGVRMRKLIARVGREEVDRLIDGELRRRLEPFEGERLTPDVRVRIGDAVTAGLAAVAVQGADA